ncbi:MAG: hypothetical protein HY716_17615 [Planctomycetes bacterium]|nr:hypothetical protein [Planctomycetota bacterium]
MRLKEIPLSAVFEGTNWLIRRIQGEDRENPVVDETIQFAPSDEGLFSSVAYFADGSKFPALVVKVFEEEGGPSDTFVYTWLGWLNLMAPGFMRAAGKYSNEVFPMDVYLANPWVEDREIGDLAAPHRRKFREALPLLRTMKFEQPKPRSRYYLKPE